MTPVRACAVVPVFDNAATVGDVTRRAAAHLPVIVVDDGSTDGSGDAARAVADAGETRHRVEVLGYAPNRGKGRALVVAFRRAAELGFTHAVTLDADAQHDPDEIPRFLEAALREPHAIHVGERDMGDVRRIPRAAVTGRRISNFWTLRSTGYDLPDTTCGYRCYPLAAVVDLKIRVAHYDYEGEVLIRAAWRGVALRSLPIAVFYPEPGERVTHYRLWLDSVRITVMYVKLALRRLVPFAGTGPAIARPDRPRVRVRDSWRLLKELSSSGTQPNELALAIGVGVFLGATPLWGLHALLTLYVATRWKLNLVAAFLGSNVSFPLLAPFLVFLQVQAGHLLRTGEPLLLSPADFESVDLLHLHLSDYVVGGFVVAALLGVVAGLATLRVAGWLRMRRMQA